MSDTPRTDAEECDSFIGIHSYFDADDVYRGYGFARQLERELAAAQAEIARLTSACDALATKATALALQVHELGIEKSNVRAELLVHLGNRLQAEDESAELKSEIARLKGDLPINTSERLFDLVRYSRSSLHKDGLISDVEYAWLCAGAPMATSQSGGSPSPRRLEEYDQMRQEIARLKAGGCARDQRNTQFCGEALKLQEENARLQERVKRLEEAGDAILWYFRPKDTGDISFLQSEAMKQWAAAKDNQ